MPTPAKPRRPRAGQKRRSGPKATARKPRFVRAKFLIIPVVAAFPLAAYFVGIIGIGDIGGSRQQSSALMASGLQYRPDAVATGSLGEVFTFDTLRYEVRGAVNRGSRYGFQKAMGRFIEVVIAAENSGTVIATPHAIGLIDKDGTQYAQLPQFSMDGTRYPEVLERGLEPGAAGAFFALFDVASSSTGLWLSFHARDGTAARIVSLGM